MGWWVEGGGGVGGEVRGGRGASVDITPLFRLFLCKPDKAELGDTADQANV